MGTKPILKVHRPLLQHALLYLLVFALQVSSPCFGQNTRGHNPIIHADVPDMSMIRVGDNYYMSSTTMHMNPGVPIMKSTDLINWELVNYAYDTLAGPDALSLQNGKDEYGRGTWASCLRYHQGKYYLSTFSQSTNKTYIFITTDIEKGPWEQVSFTPAYHDHTLFFHESGKIYMIWGAGRLRMLELKEDLSGVKPGSETVLIENATAPSGTNIMLPAEGSQIFHVQGKYYLYNISWPRGGMRTVIVHRADEITGPYEGRVALEDRGIAQGGLIDTPDGRWYSYLFRDYGAVGRIPYLTPTRWQDGWPVIGDNGVVPSELEITGPPQGITGIVRSDEFERGPGDPDLPLQWQWNHHPVNEHWSVGQRPGHLRLINDRIDTSMLHTRNTLTQRTYGPTCSGSIAIDVRQMNNGDVAGLAALQKAYGFVGVKKYNGQFAIVMVDGSDIQPVEVESIQTDHNKLFLKIDMDFRDLRDRAYFYYSLDGANWERVGNELQMKYTLPHFMGYRFALFNYSTRQAGGYVDIDWFRTTYDISENR